ncbi:hypothetical protein L226DRAFT_5560 [Lentinus tigrinus ALCF2SS1-7]|uniref:uncharacterized protein n=1 Tax=Lentinus tigrinus ALCF2SS1-7 TaxID=1328758 RepID=UPI001165FBCF|nr:hypothetical protein L226DRAFT_5560 [Lentinus tigrinus ALCF2SS1-7]
MRESPMLPIAFLHLCVPSIPIARIYAIVILYHTYPASIAGSVAGKSSHPGIAGGRYTRVHRMRPSHEPSIACLRHE